MQSYVKSLTNGTETTNGDVAYKSTLNATLDLFSRGATSDDKLSLVANALVEDVKLGTKCALYLRDVRNGQGNRDIYTTLIAGLLAKNEKEILKLVIDNTPEVGSWKDLIKLIDPEHSAGKRYLNNLIIKKIKSHYKTDALLAKWLPRQGKVAKFIISQLKLSHGDYRRHIAALSTTVEQKMCAKKWHEITYEHVPSLANRNYSNAFKRNDSSRYEDYLERVKSGETTVNSGTLYPHEIVAGTMHGKDALWKGLPNLVPENVNILPVMDLSDSMTWSYGNKYQPLDISLGLGLYFAENNHGALKNIVMGFADNPKVWEITGTTLDAKLNSIKRGQVGYSTNIEKVYEKALQTSIESGEDIDSLLIVSDMQFNQSSCKNSNVSTFKAAKAKFDEAGKKFPTIIFWNVNATYGNSPVTQHETGAILVDGYSPNILKSLFTGELAEYTPLKAMLEVIEPMYSWLD